MKTKKIHRFFATVVTAILMFIIIIPFAYMITRSVYVEGSYPMSGYYQVFLASQRYLFTFWRTILLCAIILLGQTIFSILAGFGFAKYDFKGKNILFFLLLIVMVLPLQVTLVPNFRILDALGLLDTQSSLVLPAIFAPLGTFLMTQSFKAVPDEILDASQLDGAGTMKSLWYVCVPMSMNGVASVVVLAFLESWNMVEQPVTYLKEITQYPLSVSLAYTGGVLDVRLACCVLTLLPALLLFLRFRTELVQGIVLAETR